MISRYITLDNVTTDELIELSKTLEITFLSIGVLPGRNNVVINRIKYGTNKEVRDSTN